MRKTIMRQIIPAFVLTAGLCVDASCGVPVVSDIMVTDVSTRSFSVIWLANEPSIPDLQVFDDQNGLIPTVNITTIPQPVEDGNGSIQEAAEDNGVMKVMVTGLEPDTTYYFVTITTSKSTGETVFYPDAAPMPELTTEVKVVRTEVSGMDEIHFSNDIIVHDCYLPGGAIPAEGTILVADMTGADYPVTSFVGDGIASPAACVDLNNLFSSLTYENLPARGGEELTLTRFMGIHGMETEHYFVPEISNLAEMKRPSATSPCAWDIDTDGDVDGKDLSTFASGFGGYSAGEFSGFAGEFGAADCYVSGP